MTDKGWNAAELARRLKVATSTVTRFLNGSHQTARILKRIAKKLGHEPNRYYLSADTVEEAVSR